MKTSILIFLLLISNYAFADIEKYVGDYEATCSGKGPDHETGSWNWSIRVSHVNDDGQPHPESLTVDESSSNQDHIWLFTFDNVGKPEHTLTEGGGEFCNKSTWYSEEDAASVKGRLDSYGYPGCGNEFDHDLQAHWNSGIELDGEGTLTYRLQYDGYGGNYDFSCSLKRSSPHFE